ncbi:MAG: hypothetical protein OXF56_15520 [Rhodobacteraceae bacterium]|nr:hypothetical protein [Paracoccaceae bacterium]
MTCATTNRSILNSPIDEPLRHWRDDRATRLINLVDRRLSTGLATSSPDSGIPDDPGHWSEIPVAFISGRMWELLLPHAMIPTCGYRARLMNESVAAGPASLDPGPVGFVIQGKRVKRCFETSHANGERMT